MHIVVKLNAKDLEKQDLKIQGERSKTKSATKFVLDENGQGSKATMHNYTIPLPAKQMLLKPPLNKGSERDPKVGRWNEFAFPYSQILICVTVSEYFINFIRQVHALWSGIVH